MDFDVAGLYQAVDEQRRARGLSWAQASRDPPPNRVLRFDTRMIYDLLEAQRLERNMTWAAVAREIGGLAPASLTRLANGGRTAFPDVMRILAWLNRSAASVTRLALF